MEAFFMYLVKASGILGLFYIVYLLFLRKETLFKENRRFLLLGILSALVLPLITIPVYVEITPTPFAPLARMSTSDMVVVTENSLDPWLLAASIYYAGVVILLGRFGIQLWSLRTMIFNNNTARKDQGFVFIETSKNIGPFSFFNYIIYNPAYYTTSELQAILEHEKAHCSQKHSIDILVSHLVTIILWINPLSWLYRNTIRQNLEFLADASATTSVPSIKKYQYALLKVSGNSMPLPIVNHFYNSLIKKRIVMLQKSESSKRNVLKSALVLPALALFLISFNTKEVYVPAGEKNDLNWVTLDDGIKIEITINKDTTDEELEKMKQDMAKEGVDFSYTVVRNNNKEIIDLNVDMNAAGEKGKQFKGSSSFNNDGEPIDPVTLVFDKDSNFLYMGNAGDKESSLRTMKNKMVWVVEEDGDMDEEMIEKLSEEGVELIKIMGDEEGVMNEDGNVKKIIKIKKGDEGEDGKRIIIKKIKDDDMDEDEEIKIIRKRIKIKDGEEMEEIHEGGEHEKHIKIIKSEGEKGKNVFIIKDSDDEEDIEVISKEGGAYFFMDTGAGEKPLYIVDGKEVKEKKFKALAPEEIATINVFKGDKAIEKYGKKAKDGVIEITTKKNNK
jgi:hypothetical protein